MKVSEVIEQLKQMPQDYECLLAINQSAGFPDDYIEVYPVEEVINYDREDSISTPITGYWYDNPDDESKKVLLYVFP